MCTPAGPLRTSDVFHRCRTWLASPSATPRRPILITSFIASPSRRSCFSRSGGRLSALLGAGGGGGGGLLLEGGGSAADVKAVCGSSAACVSRRQRRRPEGRAARLASGGRPTAQRGWGDAIDAVQVMEAIASEQSWLGGPDGKGSAALCPACLPAVHPLRLLMARALPALCL